MDSSSQTNIISVSSTKNFSSKLTSQNVTLGKQAKYGICEYMLIFLSIIILLLTLPLSICCAIKVVPEYQRAVIFRLGKVKNRTAKGPGLFLILPCIDNVFIADLRTQTFDIPPQEILTKDSVTATVDAVVYIKVTDPTISIVEVENAPFATRVLAATALRNVFGTKTLQEILSDRNSIDNILKEILDSITIKWGVSVERVEIKDVSIPDSMQRSMASEAEAVREAKAAEIASIGEKNASHSLKKAADIISQSPTALQLRYLQTLTNISADKDSLLLFPIPIDMAAMYKHALNSFNPFSHNPKTPSVKSLRSTRSSIMATRRPSIELNPNSFPLQDELKPLINLHDSDEQSNEKFEYNKPISELNSNRSLKIMENSNQHQLVRQQGIAKSSIILNKPVNINTNRSNELRRLFSAKRKSINK